MRLDRCWPGSNAGIRPRTKTDRQDEDSQRDGAVAPVDEEECGGEDEGEECLDLVRFDGQAMVGGVEHLRQRDEVEEESSDGDGMAR